MRLSKANTSFWLIWACALLWVSINSYDDPSSIFFSRRRAFQRHYSATREAEVNAFLEKLEKSPPKTPSTTAKENEFFCVGIPSVNRTDKETLRLTVGSLVDSLNDGERAQVHLVVLLADRNPRDHASYGSRWLSDIADEVIVYDFDGKDGSEEGKRSVKEPDDAYRVIPYDLRRRGRGDGHTENIHIDHSVLVEACRHHGSPYFVMVEDDVIAARDWLPRLWNGVANLERRSPLTGHDWLYLRLFHSEMLMGWNNEEVLSYLQIIACIYAVLGALIYLVVRLRRRRRATRHRHYKTLELRVPQSYSFSYIASLALGLWTPACIVLFFLAGRVTLHRLMTFGGAGIREMPKYGCCSQGYVFPTRQLEGLQNLLRNPPFEFPVDMVIENHAAAKGFSKWALDPSILQHLGMVEPSSDGKLNAVWNFSFERLR
ncbi:unnamed protein product [Clonostachys solani]|uniref:Uncharacterized protein n=1 Tax=Clonostachys solani TaxID=160281 RepID=A0A9P0ETD9_9HYPO|nr:unnamed protein product [Clonostachys solani]